MQTRPEDKGTVQQQKRGKLYELRLARGLTLEQAAEAWGLGLSDISRYERGLQVPSLQTALRLKEHLPELNLRDLVPAPLEGTEGQR